MYTCVNRKRFQLGNNMSMMKKITYQALPSVPFTSGLIEFMVPKQFLRSLQFLNIRLTKMSTRNTCVRAV